MPKPLAIVGQIVLYALFAFVVGWFSTRPPYRPLPEDHALLSRDVQQMIPGDDRPQPRHCGASLPSASTTADPACPAIPSSAY